MEVAIISSQLPWLLTLCARLVCARMSCALIERGLFNDFPADTANGNTQSRVTELHEGSCISGLMTSNTTQSIPNKLRRQHIQGQTSLNALQRNPHTQYSHSLACFRWLSRFARSLWLARFARFLWLALSSCLARFLSVRLLEHVRV